MRALPYPETALLEPHVFECVNVARETVGPLAHTHAHTHTHLSIAGPRDKEIVREPLQSKDPVSMPLFDKKMRANKKIIHIAS